MEVGNKFNEHHAALALTMARVSSISINTAGELSNPPRLAGVRARNTPAFAIVAARSEGKRRAVSIFEAPAESSVARVRAAATAGCLVSVMAHVCEGMADCQSLVLAGIFAKSASFSFIKRPKKLSISIRLRLIL